jgi:hypothetical protein
MLCEGHPKDFELFKEHLQLVELSGIRILHNPDDLIQPEDPKDGMRGALHEQPLTFRSICWIIRDGAYRSGRSPDWLKIKNPDAPAVKRAKKRKNGAKRNGDYGQEPGHDLRGRRLREFSLGC